MSADRNVSARPTTDFIIPPDHPKCRDNRGHFPIPDANHARNALARVKQYKKAPSWWDGTLAQLIRVIVRAVKKRFPSINVTVKADASVDLARWEIIVDDKILTVTRSLYLRMLDQEKREGGEPHWSEYAYAATLS